MASVWAILIMCVCDELSQTCHASTAGMNSVADRQYDRNFTLEIQERLDYFFLPPPPFLLPLPKKVF